MPEDDATLLETIEAFCYKLKCREIANV